MQQQLNGVARSEAVSFTIGDTVYVGTGYGGTARLSDFWAYNAQSNSWLQVANLPGAARNSAVGFTIGNQGYVGTGYDGANLLNDFYRFNPTNNTWDTIPPFAGTARFDAVAFGIGNYGYLATGFDGNTYYNDFWQFNPTMGAKGTWVQKKNFGGQKRGAAVAFVYGTKGYVVTGTNNGTECGDFWYYDATADQWVQLRDIFNSNTSQTYDDKYIDIERDNAVSFVIGSTAYLITGENGYLVPATWAYNFADDQWTSISPFQPSRQGAVGFSSNGYGYITTGKSSSADSVYLNDLIKFDPQ